MSYLFEKMIKLNEANPGNTVSVILGHETNLVASFQTPFDGSFAEREIKTLGGLDERREEERKLEGRASDRWPTTHRPAPGRHGTRPDAACIREMPSGLTNVSPAPVGQPPGTHGIAGTTCTGSSF